MELNLSKIGVLSENISASTVVTSSIGTRTTGTGTSSNLARQRIFSMVTNKFLGTTVHFHPNIKNDVLECNGVISEQVETLLDDHEKILEYRVVNRFRKRLLTIVFRFVFQSFLKTIVL